VEGSQRRSSRRPRMSRGQGMTGLLPAAADGGRRGSSRRPWTGVGGAPLSGRGWGPAELLLVAADGGWQSFS
jgi:hypothetical protein